MNYSLTLRWNAQTVFKGKGTLTTCYDLMFAFMSGSFAGYEHRNYMSLFSLDKVRDYLTIPPNQAFAAVFSQDGDQASATIEPLQGA